MKAAIAIARGLMAALPLLLPEPSLAGQVAPLKLAWDAPPECPQQAAVQERIAALLASLEGKLKPSRLRAEGRIERLGERYRLTLVIHDGSAVGSRVIESDSCDDLGGAAAVSLGLLVRVEQSSGAPLSESALGGVPDQAVKQPRPSQPPLRASEPPQPAAEQMREPSALRKWHVLLRIPRVGVDAGVLPWPNYEVGLALGIRYESWSLLVGGGVWLSEDLLLTKTISVPSFPGFSIETHRASLDLRGCRSWQAGRFEVAPCLIFTLDHVTARGTGFGVVTESRGVTWVSPGVGLSGAWRFCRYAAVVMTVDGRIPTSRPRFVIDNVGEFHQVSPVAAGALVGYEWIF